MYKFKVCFLDFYATAKNRATSALVEFIEWDQYSGRKDDVAVSADSADSNASRIKYVTNSYTDIR